MKKKAALFILAVILACTSCAASGDFDPEDITLDFMFYLSQKHNENDTVDFVSTYLSTEPSCLQQYYYLNIMYLITGAYGQNELKTFCDLIFEQQMYSSLELIYFVVNNGNQFTESQQRFLYKLCKEVINNNDISAPDFILTDDYIYAVLILNKVDNYEKNSLKDFIHKNIVKKKEKSEDILSYLYFYTILEEDFKDNLENIELRSLWLEKGNEEVVYDDINMYMYTFINKYFGITPNTNSYDFVYYDLLDPNLSDVYLKLYASLSLGHLTEKEIKDLKGYYQALYNDSGFGTYIFNEMSNIDYGYCLLLDNAYLEKKFLFPNLNNQFFSERYDLREESNLKLYVIALVQQKYNKAINSNLKRAVLERINHPDDEFGFNMLYYGYLIAHMFDFQNEIIDMSYLQRQYLIDNLNMALREKDIEMSIKYFDILTLYYSDNELTNEFYLSMNDVMETIRLEGSKTEVEYLNYISVLKVISRRLNDFTIDYKICEQQYKLQQPISKMLVIKCNGINNIVDYYDYKIVQSLEENLYILR